MLDRHNSFSAVPGSLLAAPCAYCAAGGEEGGAADCWPPERLAHLYLCRGLSTYGIGELTGLDRQRVTRMLRRAGVPLRPRGAGRFRPVRRTADPPGLPQFMAELYEVARFSSGQIAVITRIPERTVRDRLRRYGIRARSRGGWNREDRRMVPAGTLRDLYEKQGMTADEVGELTGVSRHTVLRSAHALGIPVRTGGAVQLSGPDEIELVGALYEDDLITSVLRAYDIAPVPAGGPIWDRFPEPVPLSTPLVKDLYWSCGAGLNHIELLTGQPAETVRGFMRREGIPLRPPSGRTPFLRRWRNRLVQRADDLTQRRFPSGQFSFVRRGLLGGGLAQVGRGLQGQPYPAGAIGIPLFDHPHQRPFRLAEPILQIASGSADLAVHQVRCGTSQVIFGRPPAELAGQPTADRAGQQFGLADVLGGDEKESSAFGQPAFRFGEGEI
jgi:hypothetical protein